MSDELVIIGAGGHAKVIVGTLLAAGRRPTALYDDDPATHGTNVLGVPVQGPIAEAPRNACVAILGIGSEQVRARLAEELSLPWTNAVHPQAVVDPSATLGPGTVVFAGAVVQPGAQLGAHTIINTSASVDHECVLGAHTQVGPGAHLAGNVTLGSGSFIATGASVCPGVRIGARSVIGAGAVVTEDIPDDVLAVGVPATVKRQFQQVSP